MSPAQTTEENIAKLKAKLRELFQLDRGDLDFGLYRIMAHKRAEVSAFLDNDLLPQVAQALGDIAAHDSGAAQQELDAAIAKAKAVGGIDPEQTDVVKVARLKLNAAKTDQQIEADTYNHLCKFFARYYDEGDFMSLRRYKAGGRDAYSIPYNGEEVKLHWANADQYYIKTTENYASYIFLVGDDARRVRFEIAAADNEKDNIKAANGKQRYFVPAKNFVSAEGGELTLRFAHRPLTEGEKKKHPQNGVKRQASINAAAEQRLRAKLKGDWHDLLLAPCPSEADPERTLLGKHITAYTAKNSFDYFIHKDLGGFLRRELDAYLKTDVLSIDNLTLADDPMVFVRGLAQLKALKLVGDKIIDFLAQLENFQKQLWLKKKFVLETQYCVTLDRVPEALYPAIAKNKAQRDEWVALFAIDQSNGARTDAPTAFSKPLKPAFLQENPHLVLDTKHFDAAFTDKLLAALSDAGPIDESLNGLLVHGENFQGLNLLQERYQEDVKCIYIDPPYNTDASAILYKNNYKNSSWLALVENRLSISKSLLWKNGILCCAIDDEEFLVLKKAMEGLFEKDIGTVAVRSNPAGRKTSGKLSPSHEYAIFVGQSEASVPGSLEKTEQSIARYPEADERGRFAWANFVRSGTGDRREDRPQMHYPIFVNRENEMRVPAMEWNAEENEYDLHEQPRDDETAVYPLRKIGDDLIEGRWHRGYRRVVDEPDEFKVIRSTDDNITIHFKTRMDLHSMPTTWWGRNEYASSNYGAGELKKLFGYGDFDFAKSLKLVEDCLRASGAVENDINILDYFAGSGTTGHAVINLNREDDGNRKYILVEVGKHFDDVLLPRIKKVVYAKDWKDGKPSGGGGVSQLFKYVRIESYEDALDSLTVTSRKDLLPAGNDAMAEDYQLRYALGEQTADNASLVGRDFVDPFNYALSVVRDGARGDVNVDLAETFNFLLGLRVSARRRIDGVLTVTGVTRAGENCLILWRDMNKMDAAKLDAWFTKHRATFGDDLNTIYVNGDHTLNALQQPADKWQAVTTEPAFRELMFKGAE